MKSSQGLIPASRACLVSFPNVRVSAPLKIGAFFRKDRAIHRADLKTDAAVDAGVEVDPEKIGALLVFAFTGVDACHRAGIDTVGDSFADIRDDGVSHNSDLGRVILVTDPFEGLASRLRQSTFGFIPVLAWPVIQKRHPVSRMQARLMTQRLFQALLVAKADQR